MESLELIKNDAWLNPYQQAIEGRYEYFLQREKELTNNHKMTLSNFASGYLYFGLHNASSGWIFREWAPNATKIYLIGNFNNWQEKEEFQLKRLDNEAWELHLPKDTLRHKDLYKLKLYWENGAGERIPAWAKRVVQDKETYIFNAQVWEPNNPYQFKNKSFQAKTTPLLIYECHIGMATDKERVGTYQEFIQNVLPRIKTNGYNAIQIMAIQEHPFYGSFGYQVSNFFAASSRFGTPDDLKELIDTAHSMNIAVIMDIVHSHAAKNEVEGLGRFDGSYNQYFHQGERREHPVWNSLCFDYGRNEVLHFLLSNCKFWLEEYHFDGFRFDGVTSMLYKSHGIGETITSYNDYFNLNQDGDAICYLTLANRLIHTINKHAITIAEEVSGMPGLAVKINQGGYGFDYRLAMNIPDYWIKLIKEKKDQDWHPLNIWEELTNRRTDEKTISYVESHDQALVGDKTIIFRLIDAEMYNGMSEIHKVDSLLIDRGIALHKIIRLVTASTICGGYLNFMGNEFGHPEWIDFPRQGNSWSYKYARRQWHLADDNNLKYKYLYNFDKDMILLINSIEDFQATPLQKIWDSERDQVLAFCRNDLVFVFNFNPVQSFTDYGFLVAPCKYQTILNTDSPQFGGFGLIDDKIEHFTTYDKLYEKEKKEWLKLYLPARTAMVLKRIKWNKTKLFRSKK